MAKKQTDKDAYGRFLQDTYMNRLQGDIIIERDDGLLGVDAADTYLSTYRQWHPYERRCLKKLEGRILDIGCGAGRHSLYLQEKGCKVTGIDNSPLAIRTCRKRGLKDAKRMSIMETSKLRGTYDAIIMLGNNFGLMGSERRARTLLKRFHKMTNPHAKIIVQTLDPYETDNPYHLKYHRQNKKRGRMPGQLRLRVRYCTYVSTWIDYLFVSPAEMMKLVKGTGWEIERFWKTDAPTYIAVIKRV